MNIDELQAGRELDALIAEKVMEWTQCGFDEIGQEWTGIPEGGQPGYHSVIPSYTTNIAAAWQVVEKLGMQCGFSIHEKEPFAMHNGISLVAETVPLAICRAALKAVQDEPTR